VFGVGVFGVCVFGVGVLGVGVFGVGVVGIGVRIGVIIVCSIAVYIGLPVFLPERQLNTP
jgi:hypothetical protein